MARIITFCNQKGGVGKSTTAMNVGVYCAAVGKRVLLVEIDPQANATSGLGVNKQTFKYTIYDALIKDIDPRLVIKKTKIKSPVAIILVRRLSNFIKQDFIFFFNFSLREF